MVSISLSCLTFIERYEGVIPD